MYSKSKAMKYKQQAPIDDWSDIDKCIKNSEINLKHLQDIDKAQEAKGEQLLYRYFYRPVADGRAWYQVTKVTSKTATVTWCAGICLDDYVDMMLGEEATISRGMIENMVNGRIALEKLFAH